MKRLLIRLLSVGLTFGAAVAWSHHSGAMFDRAKVVTLNGTVKAYEYTSPHSWIRLLVGQPGGSVVEWDIELAGRGIRPEQLKSGDKIRVRGHPLRDGRRGASLIDVTFPDGRTIKQEHEGTTN
jgi:hypothetical protein